MFWVGWVLAIGVVIGVVLGGVLMVGWKGVAEGLRTCGELISLEGEGGLLGIE